VKELSDSGFMHESGLEVFKNRDLKMANLYSFEQKDLAFTKEQKEEFTKHKKAWEFFEKQAPSYKKPAIWWVVGAKQEETKVKRLKILIENSENGEKIPHLRPRVRGKK
jgi:hypothetical protein